MNPNNSVSLYIIKCADNSYYTGIANNLKDRLQKHITGNEAQFLKREGKSPFKMFLIKEYDNYQKASKHERTTKAFTKERKENLIKKGTEVLLG